MEFRKERLESQLSVSSSHTPNQQTCLVNEDIALTSETAIERSDVVEVEKTMIIQKKIIINEKYPKVTGNFPTNPISYENDAACFNSNASLFYCEGEFQDSQESGKMEIASQESLDSRMDISSQCSHLSAMEYSSQESDVAIEPATDVCIPSSSTMNSSKAKEICAIVHIPDVLQKDDSKNIQKIEKPTFIKECAPDNENGLLNAEGDISEINGQECGKYEEVPENEVEYFECKDSFEEYYDRKLSTKKSLLSREEAVAAREAACMSREKAIEEREASLAGQEIHSSEATDDVIPSPKRLKLISVFEYS